MPRFKSHGSLQLLEIDTPAYESAKPTQQATVLTSRRWIIFGAILTLSLLATAYAGKGLYGLALVGGREGACDMEMRWTTMHYLLQGKNPLTMYDRYRDELCSGMPFVFDAERHKDIDPRIGLPGPMDYPPWAYFTAVALMWPVDWQMARYWYAGVNVLSLVLIGAFGYRTGRPYGREVGFLFAVSALAMGSICRAFGNGQFAPLIVASLIAAWWLDRKGHSTLAGIALGVSLFKPTIAAPFLVPFFMKRRWTVLIVAMLYIVVGSCFIWWRSGISPFVLLKKMQELGCSGVTGNDLLAFAAMVGLHGKLAVYTVAGTVVILTAGMFFYWRNATMLYLFAVAAVGSRLWTYHRASYDDVTLVFLLMAVGDAAMFGRSRIGIAAFATLGLVLWMPARLTESTIGMHVGVWMPMLFVWIAAMGVLLFIAPKRLIKPSEGRIDREAELEESKHAGSVPHPHLSWAYEAPRKSAA